MPLVSVITRTKDRPLMMARAAKSILGQRFADSEWMIVNDGGSKGPIDELAESSRKRGLTVRVLHNDESLGMEGASNRGIQATDSQFIIIHDDDDTWHEAFLATTTDYLRDLAANSNTKGTVTRSMKVIEKIRDDRVVEVRRVPYDRDLSALTLLQMARLGKVPPPISFLYKREVLDRIGLYRADLPVLGDWEFNLRFLRHFDIDVIPQFLANYHWRARVLSGTYANTVVAGIDRHAVVAARLRNELLRQELDEGKVGLGFLVNMCGEFQHMNARRDSLPRKLIRRVLPRSWRLRIADLLGM